MMKPRALTDFILQVVANTVGACAQSATGIHVSCLGDSQWMNDLARGTRRNQEQSTQRMGAGNTLEGPEGRERRRRGKERREETETVRTEMPPERFASNTRRIFQVRGLAHFLGHKHGGIAPASSHNDDGGGGQGCGPIPTRHVSEWETMTRRAYRGEDGSTTPAEEVMPDILSARGACLVLLPSVRAHVCGRVSHEYGV